jgi:hypothetical protein
MAGSYRKSSYLLLMDYFNQQTVTGIIIIADLAKAIIIMVPRDQIELASLS